MVPGGGDTTDLPRSESEITRGSVSYQSSNCTVASKGARESVTFDGLRLGIFSGDLRFTVYKGSNLLRQEAIAKTQEPSVAYIYKAGLKGFPSRKAPRCRGATPRSTGRKRTWGERRIPMWSACGLATVW